ncbi:TetR/AcrR family transcriptional regulator [Actinoalloteichus spitiensis]|uniref:TetR/AcrR family transcriptional regulator n=1 Tax=Actinoalloteichus spitiensis TaxID=252394 RepID=UPI0003609A40|nr:TetR/AcrR family transcriptional regulator [Actinoalloteichus spitiensis]
MNQRDALLTGAKRCLIDKGYSGTTARDIAAASGAHLGSIGYHFGSKDRLMNLAALELTSEWGDALEVAVRAVGGDTPHQRLTALVTHLLQRLPDSRDLQVAGLQAMAHAQIDPEFRAQLAQRLVGARCELAAVVLGIPEVTPGSAEEQGTGTLVYSLITGLVAQALVDPATVRDPHALAAALAALT